MQQVQLAETIQKEHASYVQTQGNTAAALLQRMEERYDAVKEAEEGLKLAQGTFQAMKADIVAEGKEEADRLRAVARLEVNEIANKVANEETRLEQLLAEHEKSMKSAELVHQKKNCSTGREANGRGVKAQKTPR